MRHIECSYFTNKKCDVGLNNPAKCMKCRNNSLRNFIDNHFVEANDNPIPEKCPPLSYDGPAEQTAGYKCPVCGTFTNPYAMRNSLCGGCGYKLNTR